MPEAWTTRDKRVVFGTLIAAGAALRFWQYLANVSLWVDEAAVARNIVERSAGGLLAPLDYGQVAPWGFLLIEKAAVAIFGNNEYALRLFPFLCGLLALLLMYRIATDVLRAGGAAMALLMFAVGLPFVFFPAQVKPYSCDIAAALLVLLIAVRALRAPHASVRRAAARGVAGALVPFFSSTSVFVLAGAGAALAADAIVRRRTRSISPVLVTVGLWTIGSLVAIGIAWHSMTAADHQFLNRYWAPGFAPVPRSLRDLLWPLRQITSAFGVFSAAPPALDGGLHYRNPLVFASLSLAGAWSLWRRNRSVSLLVFTPIVVALVAAEAHLYPFSGRVAVFAIPLLVLAAAAAADDARLGVRPAVGQLGLVVFAIVAAIAIQALYRNPPPDRQEEMKSLLAYVREHRAPGDPMYVYYGAGQAFLYYAPRYGFRPDDYVVGSCARHEPRVYLNELDRFRGAPRLWTIFAHSLQGGREIRFLTGYLDRIGRRVDVNPEANAPLGAGAYSFLYDLSDPVRLRAASARDYPTPADEPDTSWLCYGTMSALTRSSGR